MQPEIQKVVSYQEEIHVEGYKWVESPAEMFAVAAVLTNPWAGQYVEDLKPIIMAYSPELGALLTDRITNLTGGDAQIEAFGKAGVGLDGEIEHASDPVHTLRFGNHFRETVSAKSYLLPQISATAQTRQIKFH